MKLILFHGTSAENAKEIEKNGFVSDKKYNWKVASKKGFVYLSSAYAPFYAMNATKDDKLALIKIEVDSEDCYPEDDFIMTALGHPKYNQAQLDLIDLENFKKYWNESLKFMGNVAVRADKIKILGIRIFDGKMLIMRCDPVISTLNFRIMGNYYNDLSNWIFDGKDIMDFKPFMHDAIELLKKSGKV